ncbi:MAG: COG1470 family protein [Gaiellaceae bacterium]
MRQALVLAGFTALVLASAPSAAGADADRPRVALSVSPARLALAAPGARTIKLRNSGAEQVVVDVTRRPLDPQPAAKTWLQISPARLVLHSGENAILTLRASPPLHAEPGEHHVLVLLTTRPLHGGRVNVQVRLGVRIRMVVPGNIVRNAALGGLRIRRSHTARFMFVSVTNRGNVTVPLRGRVTALLLRRGQRLAQLTPRGRRALLPGARAVLTLRYNGRVRGLLTVVVRIRLGPGVRAVERRYRVRL